MNPLRLASFSTDNGGGNPAGVVICEKHPDADRMQALAAEIGYSETVFAQPEGDGWRVRYFSPENEVPFCGHATIALGAALAERFGDGVFPLTLNDARITVEGTFSTDGMSAALQSPPTHSHAATDACTRAALDLFDLDETVLDQRFTPTIAQAGATHLVLVLNSRTALAAMQYDLDAGRAFMRAHDLVTVALVWVESDQVFHVRNAFASGGVLEDPATGAAAAAFAGYLRDLGWPHNGKVTLIQGADMGARSLLTAEIPATPGSAIRVSGAVRKI